MAAIYARLTMTMGLTLVLGACGGGGGGDTSNPPPVPTPTVTLNSEFTDYLTSLADKHILPAYQLLHTDAVKMQQETSRFCGLGNATESDLAKVQSAWGEVNKAWQRIQWLGQGLMGEDNRNFRMQFWPDGNDAVPRGVEGLLSATETVDAAYVANRNVGGQGLPALELLLFSADPADSLLTASDKDKRCEVTQAIAQNVLNVSNEVLTGWQASGGNFRQSLINGAAPFSSTTDAIEELVTNWLERLERVKDEKLMLPLGAGSPGVPQLAEHYLSDQSLQSIVLNLRSFKQVYQGGDGSGKGFDDILANFLQQEAINTQMLEAIDGLISDAEGMQTRYNSFNAMLADAQGRAELQAMIDKLRVLRDVLTSSFVQALDINIGFNSNDGD